MNQETFTVFVKLDVFLQISEAPVTFKSNLSLLGANKIPHHVYGQKRQAFSKTAGFGSGKGCGPQDPEH